MTTTEQNLTTEEREQAQEVGNVTGLDAMYYANMPRDVAYPNE